jgi:hypothetical protein
MTYLKRNFGFWGSAALYVAEKGGGPICRSHSGSNGRGVEHHAIQLEGTMRLRRFGEKRYNQALLLIFLPTFMVEVMSMF